MRITAKVALGALGLVVLGQGLGACASDPIKPIGSGGGSVASGGGNGTGASAQMSGGNGATVGGGGNVGGGAAVGGAGAIAADPVFDGNGTWIQGASMGGAGGEGGQAAAGGGNAAGIQGAFYILEDSVKNGELLDDGLMHSDFDGDSGTNKDVEPSQFDDGTVKPCISGTAAQVLDSDYSSYWGGGIGLNLNETGGEGSVQRPWNATEAGVSAFEFSLSGDAGGADVRLKATIQDDPATTDKNEETETNFCVSVKNKLGKNPIRVSLSEITEDCWSAGGDPVDPTKLMALQWQIVTGTSTPYTVKNFCIESLGTVPAAK